MKRRAGQVHILNGTNLGELGRRQPEIYGHMTCAALHRHLETYARTLRLTAHCRQTDAEGEYVRWLHTAGQCAAGLIVNPGGWTHTSVAIRDAIAALPIPTIEVHLSNIFAREGFRGHSFVAPIVHGMIAGLGVQGYELALATMARMLNDRIR